MLEKKKKLYDLEERTLKFAMNCKEFIKRVPRNIYNVEYMKQLVRSSASVGANYIEANESFSKKDKTHKIKISRKESKESRYWLRLIDIDPSMSNERDLLTQEATELMNIFGAIIIKLN